MACEKQMSASAAACFSLRALYYNIVLCGARDKKFEKFLKKVNLFLNRPALNK